MTSSPSTPPNRRRRRIVVITIAVLVLGLGWWFWPRVDQRFVGTWELVYVAEDGAVAETVVMQLLLKRHGIAVISTPESQSSEYSVWSVNNSKLILGSPASLTRPPWMTSALEWVGDLIGVNLRRVALEFDISIVRTDAISLHETDIGADLVLRRRIPE